MRIIPRRGRRECQSGFIWLVLGLLVLLIGAVVAYELYIITQRFLGQQPPASTNGETNGFDTNSPIKPPTELRPPAVEKRPAPKDRLTFTLEYGALMAQSGELLLWEMVGLTAPRHALLQSDGADIKVAMLRSEDLQTWQPMFTNEACRPGLIYDWTDTNAPAEGAFYRLAPAEFLNP